MSLKFGCLVAAILVLSACAPDARMSPEIQTATLVPTATPTPVADVLATDRAAGTGSTPSPTPVDVSAGESVPPVSAAYDVTALLDWAAKTVHVEQRVEFWNSSASDLREVVMNVDANREPGVFSLERVATGEKDVTADFTLDGARLSIPLAEVLPPSESVMLLLEFDLAVPSIRNGYRWGHLGYLGYSGRQMNLGMWFPLIAAFDDDAGWISPRFHSVGEHFVLREADFTVELSITGAEDGLRVAGPGTVTRVDTYTWRFELDGGREMALSVSTDFLTLSTTTASEVKVELFYLPESARTTLSVPRHALETAATAVTLYEELYGPYPYSRLAVVEGDFPDGMEFSGLVFVSGDWFRAWQGVPNDWLTIITAHEVSHQWWYAQVGNDQGNYPYLDEALAMYSEALFFEHVYPEHLDWWWEFRVHAYGPQGYVDTAVYEYQQVREYINAVYLQGALMMDALRSDLGDEAFLEWLQAYARQMRGEVAGPSDLWGLLQADQLDATRATRAHYFRKENVLLRPESLP